MNGPLARWVHRAAEASGIAALVAHFHPHVCPPGAASRLGNLLYRAQHSRAYPLAVALLAAVYASSYIALLLGWWPLDSWSETMRGVSPVAWLVVWSGPPIQSALWWRRTVAHARTIIERDRRPEGLNHG